MADKGQRAAARSGRGGRAAGDAQRGDPALREDARRGVGGLRVERRARRPRDALRLGADRGRADGRLAGPRARPRPTPTQARFVHCYYTRIQLAYRFAYIPSSYNMLLGQSAI